MHYLKASITKSNLILFFLCFIGNSNIIAQMVSTPIYKTVDVAAIFSIKADSLNKYIAQKLVYPKVALDNKVEASFDVQFVIEKDGKVSACNVIQWYKVKKYKKEIQKSKLLNIISEMDREALLLVYYMPNWIPAQKNNETVASKQILRIDFKL